MKTKLKVAFCGIIISYSIFWIGSAIVFKSNLENELKKHNILYDTITINPLPFSIGAKVYKPRIELNKDYTITSNDVALIKASFLGQKYNLTLPKNIQIIGSSISKMHVINLVLKKTEAAIKFNYRPLNYFKINYFDQFEQPINDELKTIKSISFKTKGFKAYDKQNELLVENKGLTLTTNILKNNYPSIQFNTKARYKGTNYTEKFFANLGEVNNKYIEEFERLLKSKMHDNLGYLLNLHFESIIKDNQDNIIKLSFTQDITAKDSYVTNAKGELKAVFKDEKDIHLTSDVKIKAKYMDGWYKAAIQEVKDNIGRDKELTGFKITNFEEILPKLQNFKYINFNSIFSANFSLVEPKIDEYIKVKNMNIRNIGLETDRYSFSAEGSANIDPNETNLAIRINNYNRLFSDLLRYVDRLFISFGLEEITLSPKHKALVNTLVSVAEEKDGSNMKLRVTIKNDDRGVLMGGKNTLELLTLFSKNKAANE